MSSPVVRLRHGDGDPALVASALVVFAMFVRGAYSRCPACGVVEPHGFDPASVSFHAPAPACPCGGVPLAAAACDALVQLDAHAHGPIHLPTVAAWLGVDDLVVDAVEPGHRAIEADVATRRVHAPEGGTVERVDTAATLRGLVGAHRQHRDPT